MKFAYSIVDKNGRQETGYIEAPSSQEAVRRLASEGGIVFELREASPAQEHKSAGTKVSAYLASGRIDIAGMFEDLAVLTEAGLTVSQALQSMRSSSANAAEKEVLEKVSGKMAAGQTATHAFAALGDVPPYALAMIASGENANSLHRVFTDLSVHMHERAKTKAAIVNALAYPAFLIVLMMLALGIITFVLIPAIEPIFSNSGRQPPATIAVFGSLRQLLVNGGSYWLVAISLTVCAVAISSVRQAIVSKLKMAAVRLPLAGTLFLNTDLSRYLSSLAMLLENGAPMAQALATAADSTGNPDTRLKLLKVRDEVSGGQRLQQALEHTGLFDGRTLSMVAVGQDAAKLPQMISKAAQIIKAASAKQVNSYLAILTPAITIFMGLLIGGLVVSVMTALLAINELAVQ